MGQSATLYRIAKKDISKIIDNPDGFDLEAIDKGHITLEKTFEGLRFVLSKNRTEDEIEIIDQIFYPDTFAGDAIDFNSIDIDNMPVNFEVDNYAVYYNEPPIVAAIASLLNTVSEDAFIAAFDAGELNENEIYPGEVWNNETNTETGFNATNLASELKELTSFFNEANKAGDFVLSFVG